MFQFISEDLSVTIKRHPRILNPLINLGNIRNAVVASKLCELMIMVFGLSTMCCLHSSLRDEEAYQLARKLINQIKREHDSSGFSHVNECKLSLASNDDGARLEVDGPRIV